MPAVGYSYYSEGRNGDSGDCHQLNNTPRKCLSYQTPKEVPTKKQAIPQ
jgi:hypothetical protein